MGGPLLPSCYAFLVDAVFISTADTPSVPSQQRRDHVPMLLLFGEEVGE